MELRDFAEQILSATSLEEKLRCPEIITDERPGAPIEAPEAPGRPPELRFKGPSSAKADFPGLHGLEQARERGRLLHFFANHELLATELMALALLRFPEAPAVFRQGVMRTLKDEQIHTRLYLGRMKQCGIEFGELPVSGFFWRCVAPMANPLDYVATLCLTFEQANLDFTRDFARGFRAVGDADTSRLLDRIYHDEIRHVAYGLKWFRRWKNPRESDWEAFCHTLKFPLSPQRARGYTLDIEARRAAGFDPAFIAELSVYARSKGRTPNVYLFNPFAEARIAQGKPFNPTQHQAQLAHDLENLPQFLCRQDDIVLVVKRPTVVFLSGIKEAGFALPEFVEFDKPIERPSTARSSSEGEKAGARGLASLAHRKLGRLRPWAWGPDSVELLEPLFASVTAEERTPDQRFNEGIAQLYSKVWSAEFLRKLLRTTCRGDEADSHVGSVELSRGPNVPEARQSGPAEHPPPIGGARCEARATHWANEPWLCTEHEIGTAVNTLEAALAAIDAIRRRGHHKIVAKEALGLAGRNSIRFWEPELLETQQRWLASALQQGRQLVIEPWLERELDFSAQLEMGPEGLKLCGYTGLINDLKGQFLANWADSHHRRRIPAKVVALFREPADVANRLRCLYADIFLLLESELRRAGVAGPVGIDAFVYRTPQGDFRLKPVVEINPRYTMGRLTVELMRRTGPGSCGLFRLISRTMARAEGFNDFPSYARSLNERFPLRLEGEPDRRIREGAIWLNDPDQAQVCLAVFQVSRTLQTLS
jgi:uncharacterized ferritin-like protein (DUF455 family)